MIHVFVYGTLKPGETNHHVCARRVVASKPASTSGCLYTLPFGYPAMTLEAGTVHGMVLLFSDEAILETLDAYERHDPAKFYAYAPHQSLEQNEYDRQKITVYDQANREIGQAWSYLMTKKQIQQLGGIFLPDGQWPPR